MSIRNEQCKKVCKILDDVLANRPQERDTLIVTVQKAFKALADDGWIPCSEILPERCKDVLVTQEYGGRKDNTKSCRYVEVACRYGEDDDITWNSFSDEYKIHPKNHHVIAWRPLPKPYEPKEDGK